jgi:hypothetical protein
MSSNHDPGFYRRSETNQQRQSKTPSQNEKSCIKMPRWYIHYEKQIKHFPLKLRSFTYGAPIPLEKCQKFLNDEYYNNNFSNVEDIEAKTRVLTFVVIRNAIKIQIFTRALIKMREEAAIKIQRQVRVSAIHL